MPKAPFKEDPAQETAAAHRTTPFQLKARPCTGKTRTLVRRIEFFGLAEGVQPPVDRHLTFSNWMAANWLSG